jgi:hypothetical protein
MPRWLAMQTSLHGCRSFDNLSALSAWVYGRWGKTLLSP